MSLRTSFKDTSLLWKFIIFLQILGFFLGLIAFGTNYLASGLGTYRKNGAPVEASVGLWKYCENDKCHPTISALETLGRSTAWLSASKVMMSASLIGEFITILLTSLVIFRKITKPMALATLVVTVVSVLSGVLGAAVAGGESKRVFNNIHDSQLFQISWSFTLFMVVQVFFLVAGGSYFLDMRTRLQNQQTSDEV